MTGVLLKGGDLDTEGRWREDRGGTHANVRMLIHRPRRGARTDPFLAALRRNHPGLDPDFELLASRNVR